MNLQPTALPQIALPIARFAERAAGAMDALNELGRHTEGLPRDLQQGLERITTEFEQLQRDARGRVAFARSAGI